MQHLVNDRGLSDRIVVDSAGTHGYHVGERADSRMRAAAKQRGYELLSRSRRVTRNDLEEFDLIIAMDRDNMSGILQLHTEPSAEIKMLSDYLDGDWPEDVPDPYYGGDAGFEQVMDMIETACPKIIDALVGHQN